MGVWAVNYLLEEAVHLSSSGLAQEPSKAPPQVKLPCPLVLRESHGSKREEVQRIATKSL
jgi:hypothetical protein